MCSEIVGLFDRFDQPKKHEAFKVVPYLNMF